MKNIGIILAGGTGLRMGSSIPKQFLLLEGKTVLDHSLSAFQQHSAIDEIYIVTHPGFISQTEELLQTGRYPKVTRLLTGGKERYHSTLSALQACPREECKLVIHDAVRPLVTARMITDCIQALNETAACTTAIPTTDTILVSDDNRCYLQSVPARKFLFNVQTPQAFLKSFLEKAYQKAMADPAFCPTDDCSVINRYFPELKIKLIEGHSTNLKITYPEDLITAEKILKNNLKDR